MAHSHSAASHEPLSLLAADPLANAAGGSATASRSSLASASSGNSSGSTDSAFSSRRKRRFFDELDPARPFLAHPAKLPRTDLTRRVYSDYFSASKSKYKSRIAKFLREAQGRDEVRGTSIDAPRVGGGNGGDDAHDAARAGDLQEKSRFSFKADGIVAVSQIIDVFCQGMMHEAKRAYRVRSGTTPEQDPAEGIPLDKDDLKAALEALGWEAAAASR